ncbi:MAG: Holliday junction resolvase RuvX [Planctomycetota bacterium]
MDEVYLGLDYGRKRIGVAVSTPLGTVHPRPRVDRTTLDEDLAALKELADEAGAGGIVIGLPHHMDGAESEMEREVRKFAEKLALALGLPVHGSDERLTTEAADTILLNQGHHHWKKRKERRDSAAACLVLQDFLAAGQKAERIA